MNRTVFGVCAFGVVVGSTGWAQVTQRMSVDSTGVQGNDVSQVSSISADGRFVVFQSSASNLVPADTNGFDDVFVRDRLNGVTERVSVGAGGAQGNGSSLSTYRGSISADGRWVAFQSVASNLVPGDTNGSSDVFVRDRLNGTTERVSVDSSGNQGNNYSGSPWISGDGRYVAFTSSATNLVPGDTNGFDDIFVRDRQSGHTERVSIDSGGIQGNASSGHGAITGDGRYVVFDSPANNLVPGDTGSINDEFIHDRQSGLTERVSVSSAGVQGDHDSRSGMSSADGRYVVFYSFADNLVGGDTNANYDVFVRDRQSHTTEQVSSGPGDGPGAVNCSISADGRYVTFDALGAFVAGDTNGTGDSYLRDRQNATFELLSVDSAGGIGNGNTYGSVISADGRCVAFQSIATNFVSGDTNGFQDIFARDRTSVPAFTSLCDPGVGGVHACPCSNAPSGPGRGCNNSSATGGAVLSASGGTYVSSDTLVFTTSGEKPSVLSTVWQGPTSATAGIVYGQGVRCVNGSLRRLYHKIAAGGSITAPDFGAGDPTVSARSAALGVPIQPGQSRYYFVSYRDPIVLGGCPAGSTFNATQTGRVDWSF